MIRIRKKYFMDPQHWFIFFCVVQISTSLIQNLTFLFLQGLLLEKVRQFLRDIEEGKYEQKQVPVLLSTRDDLIV
jgi:hypothetical protein